MFKNSEILFDKFLNIQTGITESDSKFNKVIYYNYGPTPYYFLDNLFVKYPFSAHDHLVDFGCGKGRVLIMAAYHMCKYVTGYELDNDRYNLLQKNIHSFQSKFKNNTTFITYNNNVEEIKIDDTANKFFFFCPFHLKVHIKVLALIQESLQRNDRRIDIFFCRAQDSTIKYINSLAQYRRLESAEYFFSSDTDSYHYYDCAVYTNIR